MTSNKKRVCVIGAGVVGLSTATYLQDKFGADSVAITVIADHQLDQTTSSGAAGIFLPYATAAGDGTHRLVRWAHTSMDHYHHLLTHPSHIIAGVEPLTLYLFDDDPSPSLQAMRRENVFLSWSDLSDRELKLFPSASSKGVAARISTVIVQCPQYLPYLTKQLLQRGATILTRHLQSLDEVYDDNFDVIFNCSGLGAATLCPDTGVYPVRGVTVRVKAPWVKHAILHRGIGYVIPTDNDVVVGGMYEAHSHVTTISQSDVKAVMQGGERLMPGVGKASVGRVWAGLRPYREDTVRVEVELVGRGRVAPPLPVIHNYGHGANGVALSWGTAVEAVDMASKYLSPGQHSKL